MHAPATKTYPNYAYERLWVYFNSTSRSHVEWLNAVIAHHLGISGNLQMTKP